MTYHAILIASIFLLVAFGIERVGRAIGVPSVIVMVFAGLIAHPALASLGIALDGLEVVVPIIGTVGLVLIVLEGALDIQLRHDRMKTAAAAIFMAIAGFLLCVGLFATVAIEALQLSIFQAILIAIPFAVISSAVAIPSSHFLPEDGRAFVVYESSISDILGVLVFFALLNSDGSFAGVVRSFVGGGVLSLLLAVICSLGLVLVLMRIDGHVRFIPLLAGLFGLYAIGNLLHLSSLIMVLLFGLALNNPTLITRFKPLRGWMDDSYDATLKEFKVLVMELTFAVRGFFFIILGYWTELSDLASPHAWLAAGFVLAVVYVGRYAMLKSIRHRMVSSLTWIAPRGLITVLLFLSAKEALSLPSYLDGTAVLVILVSAALVTLAQVNNKSAEQEAMPASADNSESA